MSKGLILFSILGVMMTGGAMAASVRTTSATPVSAARAANASGTTAAFNYNYMYPYMNNQMRTALNPGVTPSQSGNPISVITRTESLSNARRVVPRSAARSATTGTTAPKSSAAATSAVRSASNAASAARSAVSTAAASTGRKVVARGNARTNNAASAVTPIARNATGTYVATGTVITSDRCLADYTQCMNNYCQRAGTAYNRCYCSARLAQIDAQYQPAIDSLIRQILSLGSTNQWTDAEMNAYWMDTVGKYTGTNAWASLDEALNINWADMDSRVRGQNAFVTGHEYCVQYLQNCGYMASNLRDAYRSEIARDCTTYEASLQKLKNAAESLVNAYSE
ncbi:hypothetical protein HDR63_00190 [bacterium]|nr:hypothetical protein [bacterium]